MVKRRKLSIRKLFSLNPGDEFRVYWAKDDDPDSIRLDYVVQKILENDGKRILVTDSGYEWSLDECPDLKDNVLTRVEVMHVSTRCKKG